MCEKRGSWNHILCQGEKLTGDSLPPASNDKKGDRVRLSCRSLNFAYGANLR